MIKPFFFVGSTNPAKIKAVQLALAEKMPNAQIIGVSIQSAVSVQPMTDEETYQGAWHRAQQALTQGSVEQSLSSQDQALGVGLEGGVFEDANGEMWSTVWAVVVDQAGEIFASNGARIKVPSAIADGIRAGEEMGVVVEKLTSIATIKHKQGMIGVITNDFVSRPEEYGHIAKLAIGLWYGRDWQDSL